MRPDTKPCSVEKYIATSLPFCAKTHPHKVSQERWNRRTYKNSERGTHPNSQQSTHKNRHAVRTWSTDKRRRATLERKYACVVHKFTHVLCWHFVLRVPCAQQWKHRSGATWCDFFFLKKKTSAKDRRQRKRKRYKQRILTLRTRTHFFPSNTSSGYKDQEDEKHVHDN